MARDESAKLTQLYVVNHVLHVLAIARQGAPMGQAAKQRRFARQRHTEFCR